jgi:hypothetical protein
MDLPPVSLVFCFGSETCPFGQFCTKSKSDASPLFGGQSLFRLGLHANERPAGDKPLASDPDRMVKSRQYPKTSKREATTWRWCGQG